MFRLAMFTVALVFAASAEAALVTVEYRGTISSIDAPLVGGPFSVGQLVSGTYTYETDSGLNPDINGGSTIGQYALSAVGPIQIGPDSFPTAVANPAISIGDFFSLDRWSVTLLPVPRLPAIGSFTNDRTSLLLEGPPTLFSDDSLPAGPPPLTDFALTSEFTLDYLDGGTFAAVRISLDTHEAISVVESVLELPFSGPVFSRLGPGARYAGLAEGDAVSGTLRIGADDANAFFVPPDEYRFGLTGTFFGTLLGDGQTTSTQFSLRPLEVRFSDNIPASQDIVDLLFERTGITIPLGTAVDLAEIETDITESDHRIEFGVSFISLDTSVLQGTGYQPFPTLEEVDLAVYFLVEDVGGIEVLDLLGEITAFGPPPAAVPALQPIALALTGGLLGWVALRSLRRPG